MKKKANGKPARKVDRPGWKGFLKFGLDFGCGFRSDARVGVSGFGGLAVFLASKSVMGEKTGRAEQQPHG